MSPLLLLLNEMDAHPEPTKPGEKEIMQQGLMLKPNILLFAQLGLLNNINSDSLAPCACSKVFAVCVSTALPL